MKIAILGAGKLGLSVTEALITNNHDITLIDTNEEKLNIIAQQHDILTYVGDANRISLLKEIGIDKYDFLISCTSSDETNIIAASSAKALGCKKAIARVASPEHMKQTDFICQNFNIDSIINPDLLITGEIYKFLIEKYSLDNGIYTNKRIALIEMKASLEPRVVGRPISEFRMILPDTLVVGVSRHGKVIIPHGNDTIQEDDILYLVGEKKAMIAYAKKFSVEQNADAQKVMIVGGGRTGYFLAQRLSEYGALVKLIEANRKRCIYLSNNLRNVVVLNGNGTDMQLLVDENIDEMDAFVAVTGFDEENLLIALTAKNHGVEDVIAKVSHENYGNLTSELEIDVILNPMEISASAILRIVNGSKRVLSSVLLQGQAELLEIYVDEKMKILGSKLSDLEIPDYAIIAAINRGIKTIIPTGDDEILPGDHLIMVCLLSHIGYIEQLLKPDSGKTHKNK